MRSFLESHHYTVLFIFFSVVLAGNIPLGLLRRRFPKFSRPWARCIYIPVVFNIVVRRFIGLTFKAVPFIILAVVIGQFIGVRIKKASETPVP